MDLTRRSAVRFNREIAPGAYLLGFPRVFEFQPGQVIKLGTAPLGETRLYSIASGNRQKEVEILYSVKPGGYLTPALARLRPGDHIFYSDPFGSFHLQDGPAFWVATGTGIAPFVSRLRSGKVEGVRLVYGNRSQDRLFFHRDILPILQGRYFPCTSREQSPGMFHGRVTGFLRDFPGLDTHIPCFLCGSAEMVVDVRDLLIERGVPYGRIFAEIFF
jgi:ferredoxin--NADP+ reductase